MTIQEMRVTSIVVADPRAPGLRVQIDSDALAARDESYLACGLTHRDGEIGLQKIARDWTFASTRW